MAKRIGWLTRDITFYQLTVKKFSMVEVQDESPAPSGRVIVTVNRNRWSLLPSDFVLFPEPAPEPDELIQPPLDRTVSNQLNDWQPRSGGGWQKGNPVCEVCGNYLNSAHFAHPVFNEEKGYRGIQLTYPETTPLLLP